MTFRGKDDVTPARIATTAVNPARPWYDSQNRLGEKVMPSELLKNVHTFVKDYAPLILLTNAILTAAVVIINFGLLMALIGNSNRVHRVEVINEVAVEPVGGAMPVGKMLANGTIRSEVYVRGGDIGVNGSVDVNVAD